VDGQRRMATGNPKTSVALRNRYFRVVSTTGGEGGQDATTVHRYKWLSEGLLCQLLRGPQNVAGRP
jgi:hypothetical protein